MDGIILRQAVLADTEQLAELRALVLRDDLTRLGRYDEIRVRERFRNTFHPEHTRILEREGVLIGCVALKPIEGGFCWSTSIFIQSIRAEPWGLRCLTCCWNRKMSGTSE